MVPVPFILLLIRRIFDWLRGTRLFGPRIDWLERRAHLKGRIVKKYRTIGLIILVAIPLPGTGAWTGALVADVLDLRLRTALAVSENFIYFSIFYNDICDSVKTAFRIDHPPMFNYHPAFLC